MDCAFTHSLSRLRSISVGARKLTPSGVLAERPEAMYHCSIDRRLCREENPNMFMPSRFRRVKLLSSPLLTGKCPSIVSLPNNRTIIISKVVEIVRSLDFSFEGLAKFILESTPVSGLSSVYLWSAELTGLPWASNLVLTSFALQLIFMTPAFIYRNHWVTGREKMSADLVASRSSLIRQGANLQFYKQIRKKLAKEYGCETYKHWLFVAYNIFFYTTSTFAIRKIMLNSETGLAQATLPWGALLGLPDVVLMPFLNMTLGLLLAEIENWKVQNSEEGLKMTFKRASVPYQPRRLLMINTVRSLSLFMLPIYYIVPSGLLVHWLILATTTANFQILLTQKQIRRKLGMKSCYFETDNPYKQFLHHLKHDVRIVR